MNAKKDDGLRQDGQRANQAAECIAFVAE